jgi:acetyltransferase-like isoleucine patch superfamily enzyme
MGMFNVLLRARERASSIVRTRAARESANMHLTARLVGRGKIDNIRGIRSAVRIGAHCAIAGHLQTFAHCGDITIGDWVYVGDGSFVWSAASVTIGHRVLIAHHVSIIDTSSHPIDVGKRFLQTQAILTAGHPKTDPGLDSAPIVIHDDAWISFGASILRGVTIGQGAIVGAASVVTKDVEPWTLVAGNPARVVRSLERG